MLLLKFTSLFLHLNSLIKRSITSNQPMILRFYPYQTKFLMQCFRLKKIIVFLKRFHWKLLPSTSLMILNLKTLTRLQTLSLFLLSLKKARCYLASTLLYYIYLIFR